MMGKMFWGAVLGAAVALTVYKLHERGAFDSVYDEADKLVDKTKRRAGEAWQYTQEEAAHLAEKAREKAEYYERIAKENANRFADKIEETGETVAGMIREKAATSKG
ncbi:MAG: hypothetical protein LBM20_05310 [Rikenellaceae bacterium]|nr:hypothetical protein [Rikenellaceae bacterium]